MVFGKIGRLESRQCVVQPDQRLGEVGCGLDTETTISGWFLKINQKKKPVHIAMTSPDGSDTLQFFLL